MQSTPQSFVDGFNDNSATDPGLPVFLFRACHALTVSIAPLPPRVPAPRGAICYYKTALRAGMTSKSRGRLVSYRLRARRTAPWFPCILLGSPYTTG